VGVVENLHAHHGCARTGAIAPSRREVRELRRLVGTGVVVKVSRGLYCLPDVEASVVAARRLSGLVTCVSLAARLDLPLLERPDRTHVAVPGTRGAPRDDVRDGAVLHWDSAVEPDGPRVGVAVARALRHASACLPLREAVALGDAALGRGLVSLVELDAVRPGTGRLAFDRFARLLDGRSQSLSETFLRLALRAAGLEVEPQVLVEGAGRVDLLVDGVVAVEVDGFTYHADRRTFREDRRRDRVAQLHALPVLRFAHDDVVLRTEAAVAEVVEVVRLRRRVVALGIGVRPGVLSLDPSPGQTWPGRSVRSM
jgi:very-short-patch-repair endonuclease